MAGSLAHAATPQIPLKSSQVFLNCADGIEDGKESPDSEEVHAGNAVSKNESGAESFSTPECSVLELLSDR
jgi:hypothetical protein